MIIFNTPINNNIITIINPYCSTGSSLCSSSGGRMLIRTLPPSKGGIGRRLNMARITFILTEYWKNIRRGVTTDFIIPGPKTETRVPKTASDDSIW